MKGSPEFQKYEYKWPFQGAAGENQWKDSPEDERFREFIPPESPQSLEHDSRWPAFFPSPITLATISVGNNMAVEKIVGVNIVNRFPYIAAVSFCRQRLSSRHHIRKNFMNLIEEGQSIALQFLPPGKQLNKIMDTISELDEDQTHLRINRINQEIRPAQTNSAPIFSSSYMVYEATLVKPRKDFEGIPIFQSPYKDIGSHRVYFFEINAIQLRSDLANGQNQIHWRALPEWKGQYKNNSEKSNNDAINSLAYSKGYNPNYSFPSKNTTAFEYDYLSDGMAVKKLDPLPENQLEVDNDKARWPCFFPSSVGMITSHSLEGVPNVMPCGSTSVLARFPLIIAPCISYAKINIRYAPRVSLDSILKTKRFGCGVPYIDDLIVKAIRYSGNISANNDHNKITNSGLEFVDRKFSPLIANLPIHYDCKVIDYIRLGTHIMFFGSVKKILMRKDLSTENPLKWHPWANVN